MAVTVAAAAKNYPAAMWQALVKEYTWARTAPQSTTYDTDAKGRTIAIARVAAMAPFKNHLAQLFNIAASISGSV